jgi:hypothetical protein
MIKKYIKLTFFYRILSGRGIIFTAYSVRVEYFVPHTQQARKNFENFAVSFTAYSVGVAKFLPHTQCT